MEIRSLGPEDLKDDLAPFWELSGRKVRLIEEDYDSSQGSPVFTEGGRYTTRGWTEWTEGFLYGSALLQFDAAGDPWFLERGRSRTFERMARHVSHTGVHDHGFNNVSTYGNLMRMTHEGSIPREEGDLRFYELALKASAAVQAARWTTIDCGSGYIYSFNGPHSLFADTIRSLRSLALGHLLGHRLLAEGDLEISLLRRLVLHAATTARYIVFYGEGRDAYDRRGRVAHEAIFNVLNGSYRCPSTQQGYSPFTTWTRALAWIITGYAEELEFLDAVPSEDFDRDLPDCGDILSRLGLLRRGEEPVAGKEAVLGFCLEAARAAADFYIENSATDGIPFWDTGAPGLAHLPGWRERASDPFNDHEPVDSSAAAIAAQGFLRLGAYLSSKGEAESYTRAGLTILATLLREPYLSTKPDHQGLLLHAIYHRPNNWDYVPDGSRIPRGESCMWGDYHLREAALYVDRLVHGAPPLRFFSTEANG